MSATSQTAQTAQTVTDHPAADQPDWRKLAYNFCRLGASDAQLARLFDVSLETLHLWMADIAHFADVVRRGRFAADVDITNSLFRRAMGYETANIHLGSRSPGDLQAAMDRLRQDLGGDWLITATGRMAKVTRQDHVEWTKSWSRHSSGRK